MKNKLITVTVLFTLAIICIAIWFYFSEKAVKSQDALEEQIVAVNEIEQLAKLNDYDKLSEKCIELQENIQLAKNVSNGGNRILVMSIVCISFLWIVCGYIYLAIISPFNKMKTFALKISQGDFDIPLDYERSNYFGDFTWAFDSMRREITKARSCEREAIENNKTIIATLSHDIKTPIASIRAYAEGFEANLDSNPEKRAKYLSILMRKCDEVSKLTNDLFLHSLSDLDKLKISSEEFELCSFMESIVLEIATEQNDVQFVKPDFEIEILADKNRLTQIAENLINNARKYAKSNVEIKVTRAEESVAIYFRDYGKGIPDEDMPFIFDKFYRGRNCGKEQGSGLGLYIVKYIAEQMGGKTELQNHLDGLEVIVSFKIILEKRLRKIE